MKLNRRKWKQFNLPKSPANSSFLLHVSTDRSTWGTTRTVLWVERASCPFAIQPMQWNECVRRNHRRSFGMRSRCRCQIGPAIRTIHFRCLAIGRPVIDAKIDCLWNGKKKNDGKMRVGLNATSELLSIYQFSSTMFSVRADSIRNMDGLRCSATEGHHSVMVERVWAVSLDDSWLVLVLLAHRTVHHVAAALVHNTRACGMASSAHCPTMIMWWSVVVLLAASSLASKTIEWSSFDRYEYYHPPITYRAVQLLSYRAVRIGSIPHSMQALALQPANSFRLALADHCTVEDRLAVLRPLSVQAMHFRIIVGASKTSAAKEKCEINCDKFDSTTTWMIKCCLKGAICSIHALILDLHAVYAVVMHECSIFHT